MSDPVSVSHRTFDFAASDGAELVGDLATPTPARAGAVVCHPDPRFGGDRFNNVVSTLYEALPATGVTTLRFDFRREFDDGVGELLDAAAALDATAAATAGRPVAMLGYSFGARIALGLADERIRAQVLIAPPLAVLPPVDPPVIPTLVLIAEHDQFSPPIVSTPIIAEWAAATSVPIAHDVISMADHSFAGSTTVVADRATTWLDGHL